MDKHLHIVAFDIPWPVAHGGLVDLYQKLVSLHQEGVLIQLHCFCKSGSTPQPELEKYCQDVQYYKRRTGWKGLSWQLPYIVKSRLSSTLNKRLLCDDHPILLEGIHCSGILLDNRFEKRKILLRLHNVEHKYYHQLAGAERHTFRKIYFYLESYLLEKYERRIANKALYLAVSHQDEKYYRNELKAEAKFLPVFLPYGQVNVPLGKGRFCLYHGNLSVNENEQAVIWLLQNVFNNLSFPFVIAGRQPSPSLVKQIQKYPFVTLVANPDASQMRQIIYEAQVHLLPSFNNTGVKLKLLRALYQGRHCVVNEAAVTGSGLEKLCHVAVNAQMCIQITETLYHNVVDEKQVQQRREVLEILYNSQENAMKLMTWIW